MPPAARLAAARISTACRSAGQPSYAAAVLSAPCV